VVARADATACAGRGATRGERLFALVDGDRHEVRAARLAAFEQAFALIVGAEYWLRALPRWDELSPLYLPLLGVATVACAAIVFRVARRPAFLALAAAHAVLVWSEFPATGNHAYLELALALLAAFLSPDDEAEAQLYLRALRWTTLIVLFASGVQKLAQGYYVNGEYLAFSLGSPSYRAVLGFLVSPDELARFAALRGEVGDGPYRPASWPLLAASNAIWLAEITLASALVWRRTRAVAMIAAALLLVVIEAAAREVFFGLVFASLLLTFARGDVQRPARWVVAAALLALLAVRAGWLPEVTFY